MTNKETTLSSDLIPLLEAGDMVMADKGVDIVVELTEQCVVLNKPP